MRKLNLKEIISKAGKTLPIISLSIALQNFSMSTEARAARLEAAANENNKILSLLQEKQDIIINNQQLQNKIGNLSINISDNLDFVNQNSEILKKLTERLNEPNLTPSEHEFITKLCKQHTDIQSNAIEEANKTLHDILDIISSDKINFLDQFNVLLEKYKVFVSTLNLEQLIALINLSALIFIFSCLVSVAAIFYGDYLIKYFNLELKFPKVAKYIQLRRKFQ